MNLTTSRSQLQVPAFTSSSAVYQGRRWHWSIQNHFLQGKNYFFFKLIIRWIGEGLQLVIGIRRGDRRHGMIMVGSCAAGKRRCQEIPCLNEWTFQICDISCNLICASLSIESFGVASLCRLEITSLCQIVDKGCQNMGRKKRKPYQLQ